MSEAAPERARARGGNVFTHKLGPLPMWAWVAIAGAVILGWAYYKNKTSAAASGTAADTTGTSASDVPQFVNQTYTTVQAPAVQDEQEPPAGPGDKSGPPIPAAYIPPVPKPPGTRPAVPAAHQPPIFNATYIVRKGETLNSVAAKFRITRVELAHANGLGTGAGLRTGQRIKVPQPAGTGTPNKAA